VQAKTKLSVISHISHTVSETHFLEKDRHADSHAKLQRAFLGMPYFFSFALEPFFAAFFFAGIIFTSDIVGGVFRLL
jgi:hypothetical protein